VGNASRHGYTGTSEYDAWRHMIQRCHNPNDISWKNYGGRGISVCERWRHSFDNFIEDIGPKPSFKHTLDRINNDGNYEPTNCRWATRQEQVANTRPNILRHCSQCGQEGHYISKCPEILSTEIREFKAKRKEMRLQRLVNRQYRDNLEELKKQERQSRLELDAILKQERLDAFRKKENL